MFSAVSDFLWNGSIQFEDRADAAFERAGDAVLSYRRLRSSHSTSTSADPPGNVLRGACQHKNHRPRATRSLGGETSIPSSRRMEIASVRSG